MQKAKGFLIIATAGQQVTKIDDFVRLQEEMEP